jgi:hypothetical protein
MTDDKSRPDTKARESAEKEFWKKKLAVGKEEPKTEKDTKDK